MIHTPRIVILALVFFAVLSASTVSAQTGTDPNWVYYVGNEYEVIPNVTYSKASAQDLKLDLYIPNGVSAQNATVMYIHGGGWVWGDKEGSVLYLLPYLALGLSVVNVEYRLAATSLAPAAVEDCRCALRWIIQNASKYKLNPDKIIVTGDSAGGHLALMTGMLPVSAGFDHKCSTDEDSRWTSGKETQTKVAAIINWFGITDVSDLLEGVNAKHYAIEWFGSMKNREDLAKQLSPINYVRPGLPPTLSIHGDADPVVPYSHALRIHELLNKSGVANQLITIPGGKHGGFTRAQMLKAYDDIREFLQKYKLLNTQ